MMYPGRSLFKPLRWRRRVVTACLACCALMMAAAACGSSPVEDEPQEQPLLFNLEHLDHLGEDVALAGVSYRIVHIYANAPGYAWVGDEDEGIACVDDAARAAVVYLRHYELTRTQSSRSKAEALIRFIMYMQRQGGEKDGLFYNFVWNNQLEINREGITSHADDVKFWTARAVWALGEAARVLKADNQPLSEAASRRARRTFPHLEALLTRFGQTTVNGGRTVPTWLVEQFGADATSELLLGLAALQEAYPEPAVAEMIGRFAQGVEMMQYGSMNTYPYGAHASWEDAWHGWGNAQTQALVEAGRNSTAIREAEHFYPRLLAENWFHHMNLNTPGGVVKYEQIAYDVRPAAVGLVRLFEATGDERYLRMAGLAASWFTGNNTAGVAMFNAAKGYGYDGINSPQQVNYNSGAESTVEALMAIQEVERHAESRFWLHARGEEAVRAEKNGKSFLYRVYTSGAGAARRRLGLVLNLTDERLELLEGDALTTFLNG